MTHTSEATGRPLPPPVAGGVRAESAVRRFARRFRGQRAAVVAVAFVLLLVMVGVLAPVLAPHDPNRQQLLDRLAAPSAQHPLGTDDVGRDELSRLLFATRISLLAAAEVAGVAAALGVPLGLLAGYRRGWTDVLLSRLADAVMSVPGLLLALAVIGVLGPDLGTAMLALALVYAPRFLRVVRASTIVVTREPFVEAAVTIGGSTPFILRRHVLPNILSPLLVETSLALSFAVLAEASISFLGLGVQPPDASWGAMLARSSATIDAAPLLAVVPGTVILSTVLAINVVGSGVRESIGRGSGRTR